MAKISGLGMTTLSVDNASGTLVDIRNGITNFDMSFPIAVQDVTGVDKSAMERIYLLRDFNVNFSGVFDPTGNTWSVFGNLQSATSPAREINITLGGKNLGVTPAFTVLFSGYDLSRSNSGELTFSTSAVLASGDIPAWT